MKHNKSASGYRSILQDLKGKKANVLFLEKLAKINS